MTTINIDANLNTISAGNGTDIFQGVGGGNDTLRGNGGNDLFNIQIGQTGLIDGGSGFDRIHLTGPGFNNEFDAGLTITGVEELIIDATNIFATVGQLKGFSHFGVNNDADQFSVFLQGAGGVLNFSNKYTEPQQLNIEATMATSAVHITASAGNNELIGSDFGDRLSGVQGADTIRGGDGGDLINGGLGRDFLFGDDGKDSFVFDTALAGNFDHFGDFRPADDSIRLEDTAFQWTGQTLGTLKQSEFKVIGNGQAVDANDHILYNQNTGSVFYDVDGAGGQSAVLFAIADNFSGDVPILTFQDFIII